MHNAPSLAFRSLMLMWTPPHQLACMQEQGGGHSHSTYDLPNHRVLRFSSPIAAAILLPSCEHGMLMM